MAAELKYYFNKKFPNAALYLILIIFSGTFLISCASSYYTEDEKSSTSSYTFYDYQDGKKVQYKVYFNDDDIASLYIDEKKIPDNEIDDYRTMIYDKIDNINHSSKSRSVHRFKDNAVIDMSWLNEMMSELKENLQDSKFKIHIDKENLQEEMERLKEELKDIDIDIHFDKEQFRQEMKELKKHLKKMKKEDFEINMDEFNRKMQEFAEEMKHQEFAINNMKIKIPEIHIPHIDIPEPPEINVDLSGLEASMKDLDKKMAELDKKMKKLDAFMDEFKKELVKDGIIKSEDENFEIDYRNDGLEINGKKVPDHLYEKYKKMYKEHFGREFDPHFKIRIND